MAATVVYLTRNTRASSWRPIAVVVSNLLFRDGRVPQGRVHPLRESYPEGCAEFYRPTARIDLRRMRDAGWPDAQTKTTANPSKPCADPELIPSSRRVNSIGKNALKIFQFYRLQKSKGDGLLELFWGEQPPFTRLHDAWGAALFLAGSKSVIQRRDLASGLDPIHRAGRALFCRTAQPQQSLAFLAARDFDIDAADYFSAAQTQPAIVRAPPGAKSVESL